jgi:hypothetical protein
MPHDKNGNRTDLKDAQDVIVDWGMRFMFWRFVHQDIADEAKKDDRKFGVNYPGSYVKQ